MISKVHGPQARKDVYIVLALAQRNQSEKLFGQFFEYSHYPSRDACDLWLIVLDDEPSKHDKRFIEALRRERSLPLTIGWRTKLGFSFHPQLLE